MLGLNFLVTNQTERAIDELTPAAATAGDLVLALIPGEPHREKGQVGRAIQEHQNPGSGLPDLRKLEHANVLLCSGARIMRRARRPADRARSLHRSAAFDLEPAFSCSGHNQCQ